MNHLPLLKNEMHYAALVSTTIHIPGDERSRTSPGHGYPAYDKTVTEYIPFDDEAEMKQWVLDRTKYHIRFQIIQVTPVDVDIKIEAVVRIK